MITAKAYDRAMAAVREDHADLFARRCPNARRTAVHLPRLAARDQALELQAAC
jgi:hypothetical protein